MNREITVTEASRHFVDLVDRVFYKGESTTLIRSGEAVAKVVPVGGGSVLGKDWLQRWTAMPHLDSVDAAGFAAFIDEIRVYKNMSRS
ncbi:MAG: hypothetical protein L3J39_02395 [Verrucomicrobiales bacterium]|nr:hypothetical protein [Verrucomicrobiales bacterium]